MEENKVESIDEQVEKLISPSAFKVRYHRILLDLDTLSRNVFDETEAESLAASCLLAQASLAKAIGHAEFRARSLKRDIDFAKAEAYYKLSEEKVDGKKRAETAIAQLVLRDDRVNELYKEHNVAEKEAKEYSTILGILKDAHLTFRALGKKGI